MATANGAEARRPHVTAEHFAPALKREGRLLLQLGIGKPAIARAMLQAEDHGTTVEEELLASREIDEAIYFEALAEKLGLDFMPWIDPTRVQDVVGLDTQLAQPEVLRVHHATRPPVTVIVPSIAQFDAVAALLARRPSLRNTLAVSTPTAVRAAAWRAGSLRRVSATTRALFEAAPLHSARITFWGKQGFYTGIFVCALMVAALMLPFISLLLLHIVLTLFYLANFAVRLHACGCVFMQGKPAHRHRHRHRPRLNLRQSPKARRSRRRSIRCWLRFIGKGASRPSSSPPSTGSTGHGLASTSSSSARKTTRRRSPP